MAPSDSQRPPVAPPILKILEDHAVLIGLLIRLILAWFLPWLFDVRGVVPGVAYTDIDYHIFTDAANHVQHGRSPYDRHTYRYTPFLASILAHLPHNHVMGRYIFCLADALCGWIILRYRQQKRLENRIEQTMDHDDEASSRTISTLKPFYISPKLQDALWWLYNPLAINICTRGSSESFQVLLPVLLAITTVSSGQKSWQRVMMAGLWHGIAVHSKLYPIVYSLSFMTYFTPQIKLTTTRGESSTTILQQLFHFVLTWAQRLLKPAPIVFFVSFMTTFILLTYLAYLWYGPISLEEGLLYHFSRVDHRHNYSMHWYWIYLGRARPDFRQNMALIGRLLLLPQLILLVYTSLTLAPQNLGLALFVQTYLFVTQNKVITAQYLTWYLCLLPLCSDVFCMTKRLLWSLTGLAVSYGLWLGSAYCLEMQGWAVHRLVWMASVVYFWANVAVIGALLNSYQGSSSNSNSRTSTEKTKDD